jgi:hypothetical protein
MGRKRESRTPPFRVNEARRDANHVYQAIIMRPGSCWLAWLGPIPAEDAGRQEIDNMYSMQRSV